MQGRVRQSHSLRMHDGSQHHGRCRSEQERWHRGQAGIVRRHRRARAVFGATRIYTVPMRGWHLCRGSHAHSRTVTRHGDVYRGGGQGTGVGRHGQLLEQQTEQRDTGPQDSATTADVKAFAHGVVIIAQLELSPVKGGSCGRVQSGTPSSDPQEELPCVPSCAAAVTVRAWVVLACRASSSACK